MSLVMSQEVATRNLVALDTSRLIPFPPETPSLAKAGDEVEEKA